MLNHSGHAIYLLCRLRRYLGRMRPLTGESICESRRTVGIGFRARIERSFPELWLAGGSCGKHVRTISYPHSRRDRYIKPRGSLIERRTYVISRPPPPRTLTSGTPPQALVPNPFIDDLPGRPGGLKIRRPLGGISYHRCSCSPPAYRWTARIF